MVLDIPCKAGKIQIDNGVLRIAQFKKVLWQVPCDQVTRLVTQPGSIGTVNVTIQSTQGTYIAEMVTKANFAKLEAVFPALQAQAVGGEWWNSPTTRTHVATYTNQKQMERELEAAYQQGWQVEGQSAIGSHVNVGRAVTKFVLTGGLGLMTGVSRSKEKITITFVRSAEWLAQHQ